MTERAAKSRSSLEPATSSARNCRPPVHADFAVQPFLEMQQVFGNQAVQHMLRAHLIQTKLTINQPGDEYEREADAVADQVMRMPDPSLQRRCTACEQEETLHRKCAECEEEEKELQTKPAASFIQRVLTPQAHEGAPGVELESAIEQSRGSGQALENRVRNRMESAFGADFSRVNVHTDFRADRLNRAVNAVAFTTGQDIFFRQGMYDPGSSAGQQLLAHELTHVVQQGAASALGSPVVSRIAPQRQFLQRAALSCDIKPVEDECNNAAAKCKTVEAGCNKDFPPAELDKKVVEIKAHVDASPFGPNAKQNFKHFLDCSGSEVTMPTGVFEAHISSQEALMRQRDEFLKSAKQRLEDGRLTPGNISEVMRWTGHANAFTPASLLNRSDDLAYAVGGYQLCSNVRVKATKTGENQFKVEFVDWKCQAFDCYNWDPGKGIGIGELSDKNMCCIENGGRGKHFRVHTEPWDNKFAVSKTESSITAVVKPAGEKVGPPEGK